MPRVTELERAVATIDLRTYPDYARPELMAAIEKKMRAVEFLVPEHPVLEMAHAKFDFDFNIVRTEQIDLLSQQTFDQALKEWRFRTGYPLRAQEREILSGLRKRLRHDLSVEEWLEIADLVRNNAYADISQYEPSAPTNDRDSS